MKSSMRSLIFCDVLAYYTANFFYHLEFLSVQMKKFPEGCKILQICLAPAADEVAPGPFGGRGGLYEVLRTFLG